MDINLVAFNIPYPPNYGGAIDVYYKIKTLSELGVSVHLHCFEYGSRGRSAELERFCASAHYYPRRLSPLYYFSSLPFIVRSRANSQLIVNLRKNQYPVLLEGLHCTLPLYTGELGDRKIVVRTHNVEHHYYRGLAHTERNVFKKLFFSTEVDKLAKYESVLWKASAIAAISENDWYYFSRYGIPVELVTPFHPFREVQIEGGKGSYILIQADLSVAENVSSVQWLLSTIVNRLPHRVIIAGKNPSNKILKFSKNLPNVSIVANPDLAQMDNLIANAHINLMYSLHPQGFKLKLLYSLYRGRFCICNSPMVQGTGLEALCRVADGPKGFIELINQTMKEPFEVKELEIRKRLLESYSNEQQARKLIRLLQ